MERLIDTRQEPGGGRGGRGDESRRTASGAGGAAPPAAIGRALAAMRGPLEGPLSLAALAEVAGLSPFHFARTFRQATGSPPGQFLAALRLERAKRLLLTTDLPVTEICFAVGYDSLGTFTTRFTQLVGLPPSRVRRLPGALADAIARLPRDGRRPPATAPAAGASVVAGRVGPAADAGALIFVGLFPGAIPQGRPVAGAVLDEPGPFRFPAPPDGQYHLHAAAIPHPRDPLACLLPDAALYVGRAAGPVVARAGWVSGPTDIALRRPRPTDPPVLVALPAVLLDACTRFRAACA